MTNIKKLDVKKDERGWLAEIIKSVDVYGEKFGQLGVTVAKPGQIKGGHYHERKREWFCVIRGKALLVLRDRQSKKEQKIRMGDDNMVVVEIPINNIHWIKNVGRNNMYLLFYTNEVFNPQDQDTLKDENETLY